MLEWPSKNAGSTLAYGWDASTTLGSDPIASVTAAIVAGSVTIVGDATFSGYIVSVVLAGGAPYPLAARLLDLPPPFSVVKLTATAESGAVAVQEFMIRHM